MTKVMHKEAGKLADAIIETECQRKELQREKQICMYYMSKNDLEQLLFHQRQILKIFERYID